MHPAQLHISPHGFQNSWPSLSTHIELMQRSLSGVS